MKYITCILFASFIFTEGAFARRQSEALRKRPKAPPAVNYATKPTAVFTPNFLGTFPDERADANSPVIWKNDKMIMFNSAGHPWRSEGPSLFELGDTKRVELKHPMNGGRWLEAVVQDERGYFYGFYHNEPNIGDPSHKDIVGVCNIISGKTIPRIGVMRSADDGHTWDDLGFILEANKALTEMDCLNSKNHYFAGGHGDFSVLLDKNSEFLFIFFSNYTGRAPREGETFDPRENYDQGISVAYMAWHERDQPSGRVFKYNVGSWDREAGLGGYASAINPFFAAKKSWHETQTDVFWGPSIHYNTYLEKYVMVMNRALLSNETWQQAGAYISFSDRIEDPNAWSEPVKFQDAQNWYPQVVGMELGSGTDKLAGQQAYYFLGGKALGTLKFYRAGDELP